MHIILAQVFRIIGSIFSIWSDKSNDLKKIFWLNGIANLFCGISYFCVDAITGGLSSILAIFRNVIFYKWKEKLNIIVLLIYFAILIAFNITGINGILSFIPILLVIIYTAALYTKNPLYIKYAIITTCLLEIVYDYIYDVYVGIAVCIIDTILVIYSMIKMKNKKSE